MAKSLVLVGGKSLAIAAATVAFFTFAIVINAVSTEFCHDRACAPDEEPAWATR